MVSMVLGFFVLMGYDGESDARYVRQMLSLSLSERHSDESL
jgi:hypothetical protein